jgi:hypothetical protein
MAETDSLNPSLAHPLESTLARANATSDKADEHIRLAQEAVDGALDLPARIRTVWHGLRRVAERGEVEAERAARGAFLHYLEQFRGIVRDAQLRAEHAAKIGGKPLPRGDRLAAVLADLDELHREAIMSWPYPPPSPLTVTGSAPGWMDENADIYAGRSHVLLSTIIEEHKAGASPEEIARGYDTLPLADINGVIAYYLRYRAAVDAYLSRREREAEELRQKIEAQQPSNPELKAQIRTRWLRRQAGHASPPE